MRKQGINGDLITKYREVNKLTQAKFASRLNKKLSENGVEATYSDKAISMWENGNRQPSDINVLKALADMLNISLDELCGKETEVAVSSKSINDSNAEYWHDMINEIGRLHLLELDEDSLCWDLAMFNAGQLIEHNVERREKDAVDIVTETREFWYPISLYPCAEDICFSRMYYWDDGVMFFNEDVRGAEIIDEDDFNLAIHNEASRGGLWVGCEPSYRYEEDKLKKYKKGILIYEYLNHRFDIDEHSRELMYDLEEGLANYSSYDDEWLEDQERVRSLNVSHDNNRIYYTDKGIIIRYSVSISLNVIDFVKMRLENAFKNDDWKRINAMSIEELLKAE